MTHPLRLSSTIAGLLLAAPCLPAAVYEIPTDFRGWIDSTGFAPDPVDNILGNYIVGRDSRGNEYRDFFVFDLSTIAPGETVIAASLSVLSNEAGEAALASYSSVHPFELFQLHAVDYTSTTTLRAGGSGEAALNAFADLRDGVSYSEAFMVTEADNGSMLTIPLNVAFVADAKTKQGGQIALGGTLASLSEGSFVHEFIFAGSHMRAPEAVTLRITTASIPEPASAAAITGLAACLFACRRRRRA